MKKQFTRRICDYSILEFEDLRLKQIKAEGKKEFQSILDKMVAILKNEIERTEQSLLATTRDSRLGFQYKKDYVYTP